MKPRIPTWAYIVAIAMMLFGLLGALSDVENLFIDDVFDIQKEVMDGISEMEEEQSWEEEFDESWNRMVDTLEVREDLVIELDSLESVLDTLTIEPDSALIQRIDTLQKHLGGEDGVYDDAERAFELDENARESIRKVGEFPKAFSKFFHISEYSRKWMERFAILGIFINLLMILGGILLLMMKRMAPTVAILILSLSILTAIARIAVLSSDPDKGLISSTTWIGDVWSILLDLGLLITLLVVSKAAYTGVVKATRSSYSPPPTAPSKGDNEDF